MSLVAIECGEVNPVSGKRIYKKFVEFFQKEVDIFRIGDFEETTMVFRPSELARLLNCQESRVGMTLSRKGHQIEGVYRALEFHSKPPAIAGLKKRSHFLTLQACVELQGMLQVNKTNKKLKDYKSSRRSAAPRRNGGGFSQGEEDLSTLQECEQAQTQAFLVPFQVFAQPMFNSPIVLSHSGTHQWRRFHQQPFCYPSAATIHYPSTFNHRQTGTNSQYPLSHHLPYSNITYQYPC
jgi:hypothetical protein